MTPKKLSARKNLLPPSPLRRLRKEIDLKRGLFAERMGCSYDIIKKVEYGEVAISPDVAIRAMLAYGVKPDSLVETAVAPLDLQGKKYTATAYEVWKAKIPRDVESATSEIDQACVQLRAFLTVSCRTGRLPAARALLGRFLWVASKDLGIGRDYARLVKSFDVPAKADLARIAKIAGDRLDRTFRGNRAEYKKYMRDRFRQDSEELRRGKTLPAPAAYRRLRKNVITRDDAGVPAKKKRTEKER
jgi:transcriptional regulator with XRE-family HTH domain